MMFIRRSLLELFGCLCYWLLAFNVAASAELKDVIAEAQTQQLSTHSTWLKLLRYEQVRSQQSGWASEIRSKSFFLSSAGSNDPESELVATIQKFAEPVAHDPNLHAQCRFPGRYVWLRSKLKFDFPSLTCPAFRGWTKGESIESISLMYATGYLGNPASFYGHTLLKFNSRNIAHSSLLDVSVNYGAIVPQGEGPIPYILKGVFGGYDAGFSHIQYYFHNHNYGELELRDIWEYELALSQPQVDLIMGHLWELLGKKYTYYFFRKNCGYRMAEILELADGLDIIPRQHPYVFPQTLIANLDEALIKGRPAIASVKYHPSRQSRLYSKHSQLTTQERKVVKLLAKDVSLVDSPIYRDMTVKSKKAVLETAQDYIQFIGDLDTESNKVEIKDNAKALLVERFKLPEGEVFKPIKGIQAPHLGRKPSLLQLGRLGNDNSNQGMAIRLRPSYYDALDAGNGHVANSQLIMADTEIVYIDGQLSLRRFDIVDIQAVNGAQTGLPGDNGRTWALKLGVEQQSLSCDHCLVARFQGDIGVAKNLGDNAVVGIAVGGAVQNNRRGYGAIFAKGSAFANLIVSDKSNIRFEFENRHHIDSRQGDESVYSAEGRYRLEKNMDVRFMVRSNKSDEYSISVGYYW